MCREILNTCVRNTEEADRTAKGGESGRKSGKGVWGMIEDSKLAKTIRQDEEKKVKPMSSYLLYDAHALLVRLKQIFSFVQDCVSLN